MLLQQTLLALFLVSSLFTGLANAHERWVENSPLAPFDARFFAYLSPATLSILGRAILLFGLLALLWKYRWTIQQKLLSFFPSHRSQWWKEPFLFVFDEYYSRSWLQSFEWIVHKFALRIPALVLVYAAANSALIMPSFPLSPQEVGYFKFIQIVLAILILLETALPLVGYSFALLFSYCLAKHGFWVAVDALPVLALAYVYITMPLLGKKQGLLVRESQRRVMQVILGISFAMLGFMKIFNPSLMIGVLDHYPHLMQNFALRFFSLGIAPTHLREGFVFGFAISEILTGALLMTGIFLKPVSLYAAFVFTKLMMVDFGWPEIPHLYPIAVLLLLGFGHVYKPTDLPLRLRRKDDPPSLQQTA